MTLADIKDKAAALKARFVESGAVSVDCPVLLPAEALLDLYGEDIRTRAFLTHDPVRGEVILRPDFTVPVVQKHMAEGAEPARYTYAGEIFRRQEEHPERPSEYHQVGYEVFDRADPAGADAEVFARFADLLAPHGLRAVVGDIGILIAAVHGLDTSAARKAALMRHIWRPRRFRALLERYAGRSPVPPSRTALLGAGAPLAQAGPMIGLRGEDEIEDRVTALRADAAEPRLAGEQVDLLDSLVRVSETCSNALEQLRDIAVDMPAIGSAVDRLAARCDALSSRGVDVDSLPFDANFGRTSMEYYDGFVFGFSAPGRPDWPLVASGGRYDALTRQLGQGREIPAVGGVIRPGLLVDLKEASA
ncbi:ATP phosphoribosyltransferase regulatory subunit [Mameliella sediminis]|uniref:ATP phosphoribosyltransferase regulatory subunit n=1 Tax=Mameliella sediminis TaxID=2836866 RepID=UPI001C44516A|nr:ATP phosphoribosyltransferase regulatory subunit [Mameliella sediminis]MBV7394267.1 ATP phosphoribosyltransferase regulatory subunit [Mameliella sediminis]MBY6162321.1 ATP phosphoribosyltransferase regulatory subunit [Mameliella alba]MBY6170795.1 ATP phosphoribosyltransferase regulatory subunit [Mameliella alba]MBY6175808.1 ATP phosphoribosyltransferase regulatory subunit [Mameliella alba]